MHDSHIHLALEPLKSNISDVVNSFIKDNGIYILTQGTDLLDFNETLEIGLKYNQTVQVALGLHPTYFEESTIQKGYFKNLYEKSLKHLDEFESLVRTNHKLISAIGETGLDYHQLSLNKTISADIKAQIIEIQKLGFRKQLNLAKEYNLPLSIHARDENGSSRCVQDVIQIVAEEGRGLLRGSFHSYTGNLKSLTDILDLGFHIGFNAIITYKSGEDVREILRNTPTDRILFETDGPFLPPQSVRKNKKIKEKFAQPSHIREILNTAAEIKKIDPKDLEKITDENYQSLFAPTPQS